MLKKLDLTRGFNQLPAPQVVRLLHELSERNALLDRTRPLLSPDLRRHCTQACVDGTTLILFADSPVWATKLRLVSPPVMHALVSAGLAVSRCDVRVSPPLAATNGGMQERWRADNGGISATAAAHLEQAAQSIEHPALAECLRRIASRHHHPAADG